jgi:hypothetical protein
VDTYLRGEVVGWGNSTRQDEELVRRVETPI